MSAEFDDDLPPEESWLPGRLLGGVVLHDDGTVHVVFDDADVYPSGLVIRLVARFRTSPPVEAMYGARSEGEWLLARQASRSDRAEQLGAFRQGPDHTGPHLRFASEQTSEPSTETAEGLPWAFRGDDWLWRLPYWIPVDLTSPPDLALRLDWPAQAIDARFHLSHDQLQRASSAARQLWPPPAKGRQVRIGPT
jgi:hypothetical protein